MNKCEIIQRLKNIAAHAVHTVGEEPFVMSLDDGIAVREAVELLEKPETNCSEFPNNCPAADVVPVVRCKDCKDAYCRTYQNWQEPIYIHARAFGASGIPTMIWK